MAEEVALQAAIDAAPLDKLPRLVFCDWLDERNDPRAEGYRVLAEHDRWPFRITSRQTFEWWDTAIGEWANDGTKELNHGVDRSVMPEVWIEAVCGYDPESYDHQDARTRVAAHDLAAVAWSAMTPEQRHRAASELARLLG